MSAPTTQDLLERIEALEHERSRSQRARRHVVVAAAALTALLALAAPLAAVGVVQTFADVPLSSSFHTVIERVAGAGITAGCGNGNFCPKDAVTREQMAAFLNRSAGRLAFNVVSQDLLPGQGGTAELDIKPGDVTGGRARVLLEVEATLELSALNACPCVVEISLHQGTTQLTDTVRYLAIDAGSSVLVAYGGFTKVFNVDSGVTQAYTVHVDNIAGSATAKVRGSVVATYVPFGPDGAPVG